MSCDSTLPYQEILCVTSHTSWSTTGPNMAAVSSSLTAVPVLTDGIQIEITFKV